VTGAAGITGATRVAAVIGDPIDHSLSPVLHNAGYAALDLDWVYVALRVERADAPVAFAGARALVGLAGLNVTMPHKAAAARSADRVSDEVAALGVANTVVNENGALVAHNTDVAGFTQAVTDAFGCGLEGLRMAVIGAGGAARAVAAAGRAAGAARIDVVARRRTPAEEAAALAGGRGRAVPWSSVAASTVVAKADIVVNATPLGMDGDNSLPAWADAISGEHKVMDLVYSPPETALLRRARERGASATNGLGMLVQQAAVAFTLFTGQPAPLGAMSAAAVGAVVRDHASVE
jgi:shikimate dehydrogenase